jgi:hypothetical protein
VGTVVSTQRMERRLWEEALAPELVGEQAPTELLQTLGLPRSLLDLRASVAVSEFPALL